MNRYSRLYKVFVVQFLKKLMQSRLDFFLGLIGFFLTQISGIIFLYLVFEQIPDLQGWTLEQLIFIYGFAQIPRGIDHLLTDNLWMVAWNYVITGSFDRYMIRPMNVLFQVIAERLQPDALGELIVGVLLMIWSLTKGIVIVDGLRIVMFVLSVVAGSLIYTGVKLLFASLAFWVKRSGPFVYAAYETANFSKYPTSIYAKGIRFVITWVIPFAFVAYLPARFFLIANEPVTNILLEWAVALIWLFVSYGVFAYGISQYESAGN